MSQRFTTPSTLAFITAAVLVSGCTGEDPAPAAAEAKASALLSAPARVLRLAQTGTDDRRVLEQGRYQLAVLDADTLWYRVDVPEGWQSQGGMFLHPPGTGQAAFLVAGAPETLGVARQPCRDHTKAPTGPDVGDLVQAMADQPVLEVSQPVPVRGQGRCYGTSNPGHNHTRDCENCGRAAGRALTCSRAVLPCAAGALTGRTVTS